jgi:hypothetical protein
MAHRGNRVGPAKLKTLGGCQGRGFEGFDYRAGHFWALRMMSGAVNAPYSGVEACVHCADTGGVADAAIKA